MSSARTLFEEERFQIGSEGGKTWSIAKRAESSAVAARFVTQVTKRAATPARFVTNEVVTNRAGIAPFFSRLDIGTCDIVSVTWVCMCVCVCVRACVRACVHQRERKTETQREKETENEREKVRERESGLID